MDVLTYISTLYGIPKDVLITHSRSMDKLWGQFFGYRVTPTYRRVLKLRMRARFKRHVRTWNRWGV